MNHKIMIVAGEASGDLHGSGLVRELRQLQPNVRIFGVGGDRMRQHGTELLYHINEMSVLGFWDVLKRFTFFRKVYQHLVATMDAERPQLLILIDYPGLNLKLAQAAKVRGIKVFYYIAPQVWAWGSDRIKKMVSLVDKMAVILPFEEPLFQDAGLDATFVGHPLLETVAAKLDRETFFQHHHLDKSKKLIGLLPGSRILEVKRLLPEMLHSVALLRREQPSIQAVVSKASSVPLNIYRQILPSHAPFQLIENSTYDIMKHSDLLVVASGTATLESALFHTPLIIVYKVDPISYLIGKQLIKIDSIGLVNVIAGHQIAPEFIQGKFHRRNLLPEMKRLLFDQAYRDQMVQNLRILREKLGTAGASARSAQIAIDLLNYDKRS